jgi:peptidoglycan/LPS O-acetylase OafA/YrhL
LIHSIEGLRGIAALLVAVFHAYVYMKWGGFVAQSAVLQHAWLFVDMFFVISGYVMASAYSERLGSVRSAAAFMVRRFFRLYPLHIVTTATALLAVIGVQTAKLVLSSYGIRAGGEPPFAVEFFDLNLLGLELLLLQGVGILRMEIHNYPSWSISVEFWLYLIFALLTLVVRSSALRIAIGVAIVALCVAYFIDYWSSAPAALRTLDTRGLPRGMLGFFQGVLLFHLYRRFGNRLAGSRLAGQRLAGTGPGVLSLAQVAAACLALYLVAQQPRLGTAQLLITFAFSLLVLLLLPDRGLVARLLHTHPIQWLGRHSYSIYLTHITVLTVLDWPGRAIPEPFKHLVGLLYLGVVFAFSALTYRYVETPWRERGRVLADRIAAGEAFAGQGKPLSR